ARLLLRYTGRHQPRRPDHVHEIGVEPRVPLLVGEFERRCAWTVSGAVDEHVDAAPARHRRIDETLQIVGRMVRAGDADPAHFFARRLAFPESRGPGVFDPFPPGLPPPRGPVPAPPRRHPRPLLDHRLILALSEPFF